MEAYKFETQIEKNGIIQLPKLDRYEGYNVEVVVVLKSQKVARKEYNVWDAVRPTRKNLSLDQMIEEQNTKPLDASTFFSLAKAVELTDPIDELLADLTT